jgi:anti-anti-sigma factor
MITTKIIEDCTTLYFPERIETNIANQIESDVDKAIIENNKIIFDLENVKFISSSFLRTCIKAYKQKKDNFTITNTNPDIKLVLKIAGLDSLIK